MRPSTFKTITISGLLITSPAAFARYQETGKRRFPARSSPVAEFILGHRRAVEKPCGRRLADDSAHAMAGAIGPAL